MSVPHVELKAVERVWVKAGEAAQVALRVEIQDLRLYNSLGDYAVIPGDYLVFVGTSQSLSLSHTHTHTQTFIPGY